jgi:hypothetical protein
MIKNGKWKMLSGKRFTCFAAAGALMLAMVASAQASIITEPAGLSDGDQYRLLFVTSTTTNAANTTAEYYNNFVNNLAQSVPELAALGVTWTAVANLNGIDPQTNTGTIPGGPDDATPTYRLDGVMFASSYTAFWGGTNARGGTTVLINELGQATVGRVWTGMGEAMSIPNWSAGGYVGNGGAGGSTGAGASDSDWYTFGFHGMNNGDTMNHLYAISDVITVGTAFVIPTPAALPAGLALMGLIAMRRRRTA